MICTVCGGKALNVVYQRVGSPVSQNRAYHSLAAAKAVDTCDITLVRCSGCGIVYNSDFDVSKMAYDEQYQNEQAHSRIFNEHIDSVITLLKDRGFANAKVIEIGCGKGGFLNKLWENGFNAIGFDPAYEGSDGRIVKDFFSAEHSNYQADLVVLRHTLEHIENPYEFLKSLSVIFSKETKVYIEVPCLDWIINKHAFWDIFVEHCNYFSLDFFDSLFRDSISGLSFNGQYQYVIGTLSKLTDFRVKRNRVVPIKQDVLTDHLRKYKAFLKAHSGIYVWGAGAKGVTIAGLIDPDAKYVKALVDINPKKQNSFIAKSGHRVISPAELTAVGGGEVLVMNENYFDEVSKSLNTKAFKLFNLGCVS